MAGNNGQFGNNGDAARKVGVGVVGCGYWGPNLVRNLAENIGCGPLTICDLKPERLVKLKQRYSHIRTTTSYRDLLSSPDVEAVVIATPLSTHFPLAEAALLAGKHTFVEKPFTATVAQARRLIDLAAARKLVVMVGHTFTYAPAVKKIAELIKAGELGTVYYISSTRVNLGLHQKDVSVIWDLAPHDLSMLFTWLGEAPIQVSAVGRDYVQPGIPDVAFVDLIFGSGAIAHVQVSWLAPSKLRNTTIVGSRRMIVYDDTENFEKVKLFDKGVSYRDPQSFGEFQLSYRSGDIISPSLDTYEPLQAEMEDFLGSIIAGRRAQSDGEAGLHVVRVLEAAEHSIRNGGQLIHLDWEEGLVGAARKDKA
jgi:predicted dehydrogenase